MNPDDTVHSVVSFINLPLTNAFTEFPSHTVSIVSQSPTGFSLDGPRLVTGVLASLPRCSFDSAPAISKRSPWLSCLPWTCTHGGQTTSGDCMWTRMPVLSARGATRTKRHSTVSL